jgi:hypothetical protein
MPSITAWRLPIPAAARASPQVAWAGRHTLASASDQERVVRMFDFDSQDNYVLSTDGEGGATGTVTALAYDARWAEAWPGCWGRGWVRTVRAAGGGQGSS